MAWEYSWLDLPRIYALNLLLIPISLEGLLNALRQMLTGRKPSFRRTPKVFQRTTAPARYILVPIAVLLLALLAAGADYFAGSRSFAILGLVNVAFLGYALVSFVGVREGLEDVAAGFRIRTSLARADRNQP